jgi:hypothetical protein
MNNAAISAASDDSGYQAIVDAINSLHTAIVHANPGGDLSSIAVAGHQITRQCEALHGLP